MSDAQLALWGSRIAYEVTIDPGPPIHYQVKVDTESPIQDRSADSSCDRGEDLGILKPMTRLKGATGRLHDDLPLVPPMSANTSSEVTHRSTMAP
jgi:hypothetical protein